MDFLAAEISGIESAGLLRNRRVLEGPQGARVRVDGLDYVSYCSNDYLGLAAHPKLVEAAISAAQKYGVGAGASHLLCGHTDAHEKAESALADFVGLASALLFSTGYMANLGVITALAKRQDELFCDRLNHASLNDAAQLSRARMSRYRHLDLEDLESRLAASVARRKIVVSDSVFSMDGDIAPVPQLLELCERHDALLFLDDAHGFGVLGGHGGGILSHFGISSPRIVYMGTLGKAAGVAGAFVAGSGNLAQYLVQKAKTYVYTTAQPAMLAEAILASLEIIGEESWRRARLNSHVATLKSALGNRLMPSDTPIQPYLAGENQAALEMSSRLRERGILIPAIRPPTVPAGTARLRISLSAAHSEEEIADLAAALQ